MSKTVKNSENKTLPRSMEIAIWILMTILIFNIILIWFYYLSGLSEFWVTFILNLVWFSIAITNFQALYLVHYSYRINEPYIENTRKAADIMGAVFNEMGSRGWAKEKTVNKIIDFFQFIDKNEEELKAFSHCIVTPIQKRIEHMDEDERLKMYHKIGIGVNHYLDDLEGLASMSDEEVKELLKRTKRRSLIKGA